MAHYNSFEDWYARGQQLADSWDAKKEEIGRWVIDGERLFGERASQGYNLFDLHTIANYSSAMRRTPDSVMPANPARRVGMSARQAVAPLYEYPDAQKTLLAAYGTDKTFTREKLREEVAIFLERITPDEPDEAEDDHAGVIAPVWTPLGSPLEVEAAEVGGLWTTVMRLLTGIRGKRIRLTIEVQQAVDVETGELVSNG